MQLLIGLGAALPAALALALTQPAFARDDIRKVRVQFAPGKSSARIAGSIRGYQGVDYILRASAGQTMTVQLRTSNTANYFNVLPPGSDNVAIFIGSTKGNRFSGRLTRSGEYKLRVFLMRSAARRNEIARYTLSVGVTGENAHRTSGTAHRVDARGTMPCSIGRPSYNRRCAWTVMRKGPNAAIIRITKPGAQVRMLRFRRGEFMSPRANLQYRKAGDFWLVNVNDREFYRFSDAVITGG